MANPVLLLVDDNPDNLSVILELIDIYLPECRTATATRAKEGLEIAEKTVVDAAIIDVEMPDMDGIEMCKRLKSSETTSHIPLILITSHIATAELKVKGLEAGADDFVSRPIDTIELVARIKVMLRINQAEKALRQANEELEFKVKERTASLLKTNIALEQEIIKRQQAGEALLASEEKVRALLNATSDAVVMMDAAGIIIEANQALIKRFKGNRQKMIGRCLWEILPSAVLPLRKKMVKQVFKTGKAAGMLDEREGMWNDSIIYPIFDVEGQVSAVAVFARDITEQKKSEEKLRENQERLVMAEKNSAEARLMVEKSSRLASIGVMAAGITHEINQPLNAIGLTADSVLFWERRNKGIIPEMFVEKLQNISEGVKKIDNIIKHMRSFWVTPHHKIENVLDLTETVNKAVSFVESQLSAHDIILERRLSQAPLKIQGNSIHIEQIVVNLMANAMHVLDDCTSTTKIIRLQTGTQDNFAFLEVTDNGTGLQNAEGTDVFDPFYSTKQPGEGMGLGLAIVKQFVQEHKGMIKAENNELGGATFTVQFPLC